MASTSKRGRLEYFLKPTKEKDGSDSEKGSKRPRLEGESHEDENIEEQNESDLPDYVLAEECSNPSPTSSHVGEEVNLQSFEERRIERGAIEKRVDGPADISRHPRDGPQQPNVQEYPKNRKGRSFIHSWFNDFPWLEYSISADSVFCFVCRHFSLPGASVDAAYTSVGFKTWKKAKEKKKGFAGHANSSCHKDAWIAWSDYKKMKQKDSSVQKMVSDVYQKEVKENREYIKVLADVLLFTAKQNIAQRGHREGENSGDSTNRGNFLETLHLLAKHNALLASKIASKPQNAKYTSPLLQNEIIEILADMVRMEIIDEVKEAGEFSIMVDETKDVSKTEQLSLVLRYYYQGNIKERFLLFKAAEKLDAKSLSSYIIRCLESFGLNYKKHLVGQGYDGAPVMSGKHNGVAKIVQNEAKYAFYVHCHAHRLNLVIVDTVRGIPDAADFFALLEKLYVFLSRSYVHQKYKGIQSEMYQNEAPRELPALSDTRWACRYISCRNVRDRLPAIIRTLEEISQEANAERAVDARGLLAQINFMFVVMLTIFTTILHESKGLSDMLQNPKLDLAKATDIVASFKSALQEIRSANDTFDKYWEVASDLATECHIQINTDPQRRQRQLPSRLRDSLITDAIPSEHQELTTKEEVKRHVFYPVVDVIMTEMNKRFSTESCQIMKGIQSLNPESRDFLCIEGVEHFGRIFDSNMEDLRHEVPQAQRLLQRKFTDTGETPPPSLLLLTSFLEPYKDVFAELFRLCKIALAIPVSSAGCERSFSALKCIKTYLRNTMSDSRLSDLGVLHIERDLSEDIELEEFVELFISKHKNLRINLC